MGERKINWNLPCAIAAESGGENVFKKFLKSSLVVNVILENGISAKKIRTIKNEASRIFSDCVTLFN